MAETADFLRETGSNNERRAPNPDEIRMQLRNILESPVFNGSRRCKQFLEYICDKSLDGKAETLKERIIAVEVFGRAPHSDLGEDTIVRVGAREVRKRLAQYYVTSEGLAAAVHIDLLPGSYAPEFRYASPSREESHRSVVPQRAADVVVQVQPARHFRKIFLAAGAALLLISAAAYAGMKWAAEDTAGAGFRRFWEPVFASADPLLVAVAHPIVYHPSQRATLLSASLRPPSKVPVQRPIQVPADKLDGSDLIPVTNQYVGFGDLVASTEVASMLGRRSKAVRVRMASGIEFADLRQSQTLLIGAVTNRWTMELSQSWRFQFAQSPGLETTILDTTDARRRWRVPSHQDGSAPEDYMLICRLRNSITGRLLVAAAGVKQFGTEAAGRLLTDPVQLSAVLAKLPGGWEDKNLQIVLHARVIGNTPGAPDVEAWHVW